MRRGPGPGSGQADGDRGGRRGALAGRPARAGPPAGARCAPGRPGAGRAGAGGVGRGHAGAAGGPGPLGGPDAGRGHPGRGRSGRARVADGGRSGRARVGWGGGAGGGGVRGSGRAGAGSVGVAGRLAGRAADAGCAGGNAQCGGGLQPGRDYRAGLGGLPARGRGRAPGSPVRPGAAGLRLRARGDGAGRGRRRDRPCVLRGGPAAHRRLRGCLVARAGRIYGGHPQPDPAGDRGRRARRGARHHARAALPRDGQVRRPAAERLRGHPLRTGAAVADLHRHRTSGHARRGPRRAAGRAAEPAGAVRAGHGAGGRARRPDRDPRTRRRPGGPDRDLLRRTLRGHPARSRRPGRGLPRGGRAGDRRVVRGRGHQRRRRAGPDRAGGHAGQPLVPRMRDGESTERRTTVPSG